MGTPGWVSQLAQKLTWTVAAVFAIGLVLTWIGNKVLDHVARAARSATKGAWGWLVARLVDKTVPVLVRLRRSPLNRTEVLAEWQRVKTDSFGFNVLAYLFLLGAMVTKNKAVEWSGSLAALVMVLRAGAAWVKDQTFEMAYRLEDSPRVRDYVDAKLREHADRPDVDAPGAHAGLHAPRAAAISTQEDR